jgi:hypothetical protein
MALRLSLAFFEQGRFLGTNFVLEKDVVAADGDVVAKAKQILAHGPAIIIADLKAPDLLAVADLPEAKTAIIFNIRSSDERFAKKSAGRTYFTSSRIGQCARTRLPNI